MFFFTQLKNIAVVVMLMSSSSYVSANEIKKELYKRGKEQSSIDKETIFCQKGKNQSPINIISNDAVNIKQTPLHFNYSMMIADTLQREKDLITVTLRSAGSVNYEKHHYELKYFTLNAKSEHTVNGKFFPLEVQLVHENNQQQLLIVSIMFIPGKSDGLLKTLLNSMPEQIGQSVRLSNKALKEMETSMKTTNYYTYNGSLSVPPCTEGVQRFILKMPMQASPQQLAYLSNLLQNNNRSVQPLNARKVFE